MTAVARMAFILLAVAGCSSLAGDSDTPIVLEVRAPAGPGTSPVVEIGDTLQLSARALNQNGDSVAATLQWRTPDTAFLYVEPATGRITGKLVGTGRVQVLSGTLASELVSFSVVPFAESLLVIPPDTTTILAADTVSIPLVTELDTLNPAGPLAGRQIIYTLTTIFGQPGDTATLNGGLMVRTVTTGATGRPTTDVRVRPIPALSRPDSVLVEVTALRPSSFSNPAAAPIPGSGQRFIVRFE